MRQPRRVSRHLARQPFGTRRAARCPSPGHDRDRSPSRTTRRATTWFPPRRVSPGRRGLPAPRRPPWPSWYAPLRALPRIRRTVPLRCVDRLCCASQRGTGAALGAAFTRRALRPGNVASGDRCVRGTLPPRHHAGTNILLSKALGATGRKAAFAPRHYRIPPPSDRPPNAPSPASDRRNGSDGACTLSRTRALGGATTRSALARPQPSQKSAQLAKEELSPRRRRVARRVRQRVRARIESGPREADRMGGAWHRCARNARQPRRTVPRAAHDSCRERDLHLATARAATHQVARANENVVFANIDSVALALSEDRRHPLSPPATS